MHALASFTQNGTPKMLRVHVHVQTLQPLRRALSHETEGGEGGGRGREEQEDVVDSTGSYKLVNNRHEGPETLMERDRLVFSSDSDSLFNQAFDPFTDDAGLFGEGGIVVVAHCQLLHGVLQ